MALLLVLLEVLLLVCYIVPLSHSIHTLPSVVSHMPTQLKGRISVAFTKKGIKALLVDAAIFI